MSSEYTIKYQGNLFISKPDPDEPNSVYDVTPTALTCCVFTSKEVAEFRDWCARHNLGWERLEVIEINTQIKMDRSIKEMVSI